MNAAEAVRVMVMGCAGTSSLASCFTASPGFAAASRSAALEPMSAGNARCSHHTAGTAPAASLVRMSASDPIRAVMRRRAKPPHMRPGTSRPATPMTRLAPRADARAATARKS
ncbi:MAG: hypothetical protein ACYTGX_19105, partial [Planctomycetota bacterium]